MPGRRCAGPCFPTSGSACRGRRKRSWAAHSTSKAEHKRPRAAARGPHGATWLRPVFEGDANGLALDGDVVTGTLGLDRQWRALLVGIALSRSSGEGAYGTGAGTIREHADERPPVRASTARGPRAAVGRGGLGAGRTRDHAGEVGPRSRRISRTGWEHSAGGQCSQAVVRSRSRSAPSCSGRRRPPTRPLGWRRPWALRAAGG